MQVCRACGVLRASLKLRGSSSTGGPLVAVRRDISGLPPAFHHSGRRRWNSSSSSKDGPADPETVRKVIEEACEPKPGEASTVQARTDKAMKELSAMLGSLAASMAKQREAAQALWVKLNDESKDVGSKINDLTGYAMIEQLRLDVASKETTLHSQREVANLAKKAYHVAVAARVASQKEVNDLLQRKSSWSGEDVMRFTELVRLDHDNEQAEVKAKVAMDSADEGADKMFSALMQAILERYHEEQVWSDKIRSLSTYGSLAITSLNVLLFIITILLVEPWKRKRLVEGVEARLRDSTLSSSEKTTLAVTALQTLLSDAQGKLDQLVESSSQLSREAEVRDAAGESREAARDNLALPETEPSKEPSTGLDSDRVAAWARSLQEKDSWATAASGALVGGAVVLVGMSLSGR